MARLQAESATFRNSPHGLEAVTGPVLGQVCHRCDLIGEQQPGIPAAEGRLGAGR